MGMTEKDLEEILKKNPSLKIKEYGKRAKVPASPALATPTKVSELLKEAQVSEKRKKNKYLNKKMYEYENGFVSESKQEENCGKILYTFDSIKEYERWAELRTLEKAGEISELKRQVALLIQPAFTYRTQKIRKIEYVADFMYIKAGETVVEDVKPFDQRKELYRLTKDFSLKWKLLKCKYPQYVFEIF